MRSGLAGAARRMPEGHVGRGLTSSVACLQNWHATTRCHGLSRGMGQATTAQAVMQDAPVRWNGSSPGSFQLGDKTTAGAKVWHVRLVGGKPARL